MGMGIAQICVQSGYKTLLYDINEEKLESSRVVIQGSWETLLVKEKISQEAIVTFNSRLSYSSNINDCKSDLVIEAIVEFAAALVAFTF